jgi:protein-disulfide isomerase
MPPTAAPVLLLAAALALSACSRPGGGASAPGTKSPPAAASAGAGPGVVAEVNGESILAPELEQRASGRLVRLRQEEHDIRRQALEELVAERLVAAEAARRGVPPEELLRREVDGRVEALPQAQLEAIYEQNKDRFGAQPRAEAIARIREVLGERARAERRAAYERELRAAAKVTIRLEAPRAEVSIPPGSPSHGPADAPVTIVEFTDYECPFCHRAQATIDELFRRYPGKVRLVHLDFPLDGHPGALPAARAVRCATEQGRFWEFHRGLMLSPGRLDEEGLLGRARGLGLDAAAFASCLSSGRHDAAIEASLRQAGELGVTGTPAYFVNGRMISGARPLEAFTEIIDGER